MRTEFTPADKYTRTNADLRSSQERRKFRNQLRNQAAKILHDERVAACGRKMTGPLVTVCKGQRGPYFTGLQTCGSVWHCPVCAAKISEGRRQEIEAVLSAHQADGGDQFLVTFTMSHRASDLCSELNYTARIVWKKLISGKAWQRAKERYGLQFIKTLEVTYGSHGWHPHLHVILCTDKLSHVERKLLHKWLRSRWIRIIDQIKKWPDKRAAFKRAVDFRQCDSVIEVGEYITKSGASYELTSSNQKIGKLQGQSPWQLLTSAQNGDEKARRKFREYAQAFKGSRQLTWSRGLRKAYLDTDTQSDEELASTDEAYGGDLVIATIPKRIWKEIADRELQYVLLLSTSKVENWSLLAFLHEQQINCRPP